MRNKGFNVIRVGEESALTNKEEIVQSVIQDNHLACKIIIIMSESNSVIFS